MRRIIGMLGFVLLEGIVLYLAAVFILPIGEHKPIHKEKKEVQIYLKNNGFHTDFILPYRSAAKDWSNDFSYNDTEGKDSSAKFLQVGWGDEAFYLKTPKWDDLTFGTVFSAVLGLDDAALHVKLLKDVKESDNCMGVKISKSQYRRLISFIEKHQVRDNDNKTIAIQSDVIKQYGKNDAFYKAAGHFSMFKTCNTWINRGLYEAEMPSLFWTVRYQPIFELYQTS